MSSSAIRSSIENSPWSATISVRRSSQKPCASSDSSSLRILSRRGFEPRISLHSLMNLRTSLSSSSSSVISRAVSRASRMLRISAACFSDNLNRLRRAASAVGTSFALRSEEHTSELQSRLHLVCRLLLEKKKKREHTYTALALHNLRYH